MVVPLGWRLTSRTIAAPAAVATSHHSAAGARPLHGPVQAARFPVPMQNALARCSGQPAIAAMVVRNLGPRTWHGLCNIGLDQAGAAERLRDYPEEDFVMAALSPRSLETLIDLVEIKLSCLEVF